MKKIKITCTKIQKKLLMSDLCPSVLYSGFACDAETECIDCVKKHIKFKTKKKSKRSKEKKLLDVAKKIKQYCEKADCFKCLFRSPDDNDCIISYAYPRNWPKTN